MNGTDFEGFDFCPVCYLELLFLLHSMGSMLKDSIEIQPDQACKICEGKGEIRRSDTIWGQACTVVVFCDCVLTQIPEHTPDNALVCLLEHGWNVEEIIFNREKTDELNT